MTPACCWWITSWSLAVVPGGQLFWVMNSAPTAVVSGIRKPGKKWIRIVSGKVLVTLSKPTRKLVAVSASALTEDTTQTERVIYAQVDDRSRWFSGYGSTAGTR